MSALVGLRILVVEDEALVAIMVADILEAQGATVVGPAASIRKAETLIGDRALDLAVLDVNLGGQSIAPIATLLVKQGTPIVFATGYGERPSGPWTNAPAISKPFTEFDLLQAIRQALGT